MPPHAFPTFSGLPPSARKKALPYPGILSVVKGDRPPRNRHIVLHIPAKPRIKLLSSDKPQSPPPYPKVPDTTTMPDPRL